MINVSEELFFHTKNYVDKYFSSNSPSKDYDVVANNYLDLLLSLTDDSFESLLTITGYIPDLYASDSSEETLFSKLVEVIVCAWAKRCGFDGKFVKQKASYEDVDIILNDKIVVCDAKSFRLGRSQAAPNVKDFLKLEDMRKWISRFSENQQLGGLVAFPSKHEWRDSSDAYLYCSTKDIPVLMLPYEYLAFIFHYRNNFTINDFHQMWDYEIMFPDKLLKEMPGGNKVKYWEVINKQIIKVTKTSDSILKSYLKVRADLIAIFITMNIDLLNNKIDSIVNKIKYDVDQLDADKIKEMLIDYQERVETSKIRDSIKRIKDFRED